MKLRESKKEDREWKINERERDRQKGEYEEAKLPLFTGEGISSIP